MSPLIVQIRQHLTSAKEAAGGKGKGKATGDQADEGGAAGKKAEVTETPLARVVKDSSKMAGEASNGLIGALVKDALFNGGKLSQAGAGQTKGEGGPLVLPPVVS